MRVTDIDELENIAHDVFNLSQKKLPLKYMFGRLYTKRTIE